MFDFAWSEIMIIGLVALVVIGPKDLPRALKTAGFWLRKARGMAREFQNSVDDMIREAELEEFRKSVADVARLDVGHTIAKEIDPTGELRAGIAPPAEHDFVPPPPALIEAPVDPTEPAPGPVAAEPSTPSAP
jgi:sec-independent protein translocase protein TatB